MALVAALGLLALAGCSNDRSFEADELIAELNQGGAGLELGEPLSTEEESVQLIVIGFTNPGAPAGGEERPAGAVVVLEGTEEAEAEFARCQEALSFVCYRAANAVLRFTNINQRQQGQIAAALQQLESTSEG